jgi:phage/plasmid-associated DNA primase
MIYENCIPDKTKYLDNDVFQSAFFIKASELYSKYKEWVAAEGMKKEDILTNTAFGNSMASYPQYKKIHKRDGWYYYGLRIRTATDPDDETDQPEKNQENAKKAEIRQKCDGLLALVTGWMGGSESFHMLYSRVKINSQNLSQLVTETETLKQNQAQNETVTGSGDGDVTGSGDPSHTQTDKTDSILPELPDCPNCGKNDGWKFDAEMKRVCQCGYTEAVR